MAKEKYISVRVSEYQYNKLQREAKEAGFSSLSEYVRGLLSDNRDQRKYVLARSDNQSLAQLNSGLCLQVNKELIKLCSLAEQLPSNAAMSKYEMMRRLEEIWHLLN